MPDATAAWAVPAEQVLERESSDPGSGLSSEEAGRRLARYGPNSLPEGEQRGLGSLILEQFSNVLIYLLGAAALVSLAVGEPVDAVVIVIIVLLNAAIGAVQGYRADRALAALHEMAAPHAKVLRDGQQGVVAAADVVPGDIVILEAGDGVPADLRLVEAAGVHAAEAALTGESVPVGKSVAPVPEGAALGDRGCMLWRGTDVVTGRAAGVVVATGHDTELGRIAHLVAGAEVLQTPMQRRLAQLSKRIALAVVAISLVVFGAGVLRGEDAVEMLLTAVSLAVAAVPEALPAVVTISLAMGAAAMVRRQALVKRLPAVETLGSVTHICSDKTGTLTRNKMAVDQVWLAPGAAEDELRLAVVACNDATVETGDPTEVALLEFGARPAPRRIAEAPFSSERMRMTTVHEGLVAYSKGAPEVLLPRCADASAAAAALAEAERLAAAGFRVLAVARRQLEALPDDVADIEHDLQLLGLVGLVDPPRTAAAAAVAECAAAGIVPIMITGDHPATAAAIGERVGITGDVMTGAELGQLDDAALDDAVGRVGVYARVDPAQKIRIVRALQHRGDVVAMTGDGVNDAPALKQADIGVAMGEGGTDVARGAADLILLDNNFATIVTAVREGRRIYNNIRRFVRYTLTSNTGEIWTIFLAPFLGLPLPLLPLQILWINLVTDGLPGLALAREPAGPDVMRLPPRPPRQSVFAQGLGAHILWVGLLIGGVSLAAMSIGYHGGSQNWQSMVFTTLVFAQLVNALAIRSEHRSVFAIGFFSNPVLLVAVVLTAALQLLVVYWAPLAEIFRTTPMTAAELAICVGLAMVVFVAVEIEKLVRRRLRLGDFAAVPAEARRAGAGGRT